MMRPRATRLLSLGVLIAAIGGPSHAQEKLPSEVAFSVDWTVQQKEDGKVSQGYHINQLTCAEGECELLTVTLNQCFGKGKDASFFPKVQRSSTLDGDLRVTRTAQGTLLLEQHLQGAQVVHRLTLALNEILGTLRVSDYSGGFTKDSAILKKIITIEYVPLRGSSVTRPMNCAAMLPAIAP